MTTTRPLTQLEPDVSPQRRYARPLMGWRHPITTHRDQLTHAVMPGRTVAECGVVIMVLSEPWPEPGAGTPLARCAICTQAVQGMRTLSG